jgi:uncharacterized protein YwgA
MSTEHLQQAAILAAFVEKVRERGLPCGDTLLQKAAFVMKSLFGVPLRDEFRLHYYGPYSFDLRDRLAAMEADEIVLVAPREIGVTYDVGPRFKQLRERFSRTIEQNERAIEFAATELGKLGVKKLEPLATALLIAREPVDRTVEERIARLREIKTHVSEADAQVAVEKVDGWIRAVSAD